MFVQSAQRMGYRTVVLDPDVDSPAGRVSETHLQFPYLAPEGLRQLSALCGAITTEFENVPSEALAQLAQQRPVAPGAEAVAIAQDRAREKAHFLKCGVDLHEESLEGVGFLPLTLPANYLDIDI
jgi:5-(carboxyamino)imidazole ribonucleotide synthase